MTIPSNPAGPSDRDPERLKEIVSRAIAQPREQREAFITHACGGDAGFAGEVRALLAAHDAAGSFMGSPTAAPDPLATLPAAPREGPGTRVGPYKLLELIGEGGFGSVFLAEQAAPVRRRVALKIIKLGMDTRSVVARFEQERQALAMMDHPNIARVLDAGSTETGRPFFVMEYVKGDPVTVFADAHKLTLRQRLELFIQVCNAVQHAHTKGVIHRDIKPSNVLVSMVDGKPLAKVIDFGIAKATGAAGGTLTDKTLFTEHRQLIGTPEYMSPEQAEGSPDIDTRTDVYGLGVLLYELLAGATPFDPERLRSAAFAEMQRIIKEEEPPAPSMRISRDIGRIASAAAVRSTEPGRLSTLVRGELDWIVMKTLDKDRARRFASPLDLAADVERYLTGQAVVAAPPSTMYRLRKFVRRNKGPVLAGSAVAAALVVGIATTSIALYYADYNAKAAINNARIAEDAKASISEALNAVFRASEMAGNNGGLTIIDELDLQNPNPLITDVRRDDNGAVVSFSSKAIDNHAEALRDQAIWYIRKASKTKRDLEVANAALTRQNEAAMAMLKQLAVAVFDEEDARLGTPVVQATRLTLANGGSLWIGREPGRDLVIIDPEISPDVSQALGEPQAAIEREKIVEAIGKYVEVANNRLRNEVKRARLAEARIVVDAFERADAGGADDEYLKTLNLADAVAARKEHLGSAHADTVRAEKVLAEGQGLGPEKWLEKLLEWDQRRTAAGEPVAGIDIAIWGLLAATYWERDDLPKCLEFIHRVGDRLTEASERDPRGITSVIYSLYPSNVFNIHAHSLDERAAWPSQFKRTTLASLHRAKVMFEEGGGRLAALEEAERLDAETGDAPHPGNLAVRARLVAEGLVPDGSDADAVALLDRAELLLGDVRWAGDDEARLRFSWAEGPVRHRPTPEQLLAEEIKRRRIAQQELDYMRIKAEELTSIPETVALLETVVRERTELYGKEHLATADALQVLAQYHAFHQNDERGLDEFRAAIATRTRLLGRPDAKVLLWESFRAAAASELVNVDATRDSLRRIAKILPVVASSGEPFHMYWTPVAPALLREENTNAKRVAEFVQLCAQIDGPQLVAAIVAHSLTRMPDGTTSESELNVRESRLHRLRTLAPKEARVLSELAAVLYCLGRYEEARSSLLDRIQPEVIAKQQADPLTLAYLALAQYKTGHGADARAALAQLRALMSDPVNAETWARDANAKALLAEAEALIDPPAAK